MYEEYQTNPNPGFDPRSRYEDAGGYLRSLLGSFLNQKKESEDQAWEEKKLADELAAQERIAKRSRDAQDPSVRYAAGVETVRMTRPDLQENTPEWRSAVHDAAGLPRETVWEQLQDKQAMREEQARQAKAAGKSDEEVYKILNGIGEYGPGGASITAAEKTAEGRQGVANTQAGAAAEVQRIKNEAPAKTPVAATKGPKNPGWKDEGYTIRRAKNSLATGSKMLTSNKMEGALEYKNLNDALDILLKEVADTPLTKKQAEALARIESLSKDGTLTPQEADELAKTIRTLADEPAPGAESDMSAGGSQERVLTIDGKKYLEAADGNMYEMIIG